MIVLLLGWQFYVNGKRNLGKSHKSFNIMKSTQAINLPLFEIWVFKEWNIKYARVMESPLLSWAYSFALDVTQTQLLFKKIKINCYQDSDKSVQHDTCPQIRLGNILTNVAFVLPKMKCLVSIPMSECRVYGMGTWGESKSPNSKGCTLLLPQILAYYGLKIYRRGFSAWINNCN